MSKHTRRAIAQRTAFNEIELRFPFNAALVEAIKADIPYRSRTYVPSTKTWRVADGYQDLAVNLLLEFFPDAETPRRAHSAIHSQAGTAQDEHFSALHLLPTAPRSVVDACYRALAKLHHPDMGGDPTKMRRISEAHEALSRRLSA